MPTLYLKMRLQVKLVREGAFCHFEDWSRVMPRSDNFGVAGFDSDFWSPRPVCRSPLAFISQSSSPAMIFLTIPDGREMEGDHVEKAAAGAEYGIEFGAHRQFFVFASTI